MQGDTSNSYIPPWVFYIIAHLQSLDWTRGLDSLGTRPLKIKTESLVDGPGMQTHFQLTFPIKMQCNAIYVTSHLGCLRWLAGVNFPLLYMGTWPMFRQLLLRIQGKYRAALTPIKSSSIDLFNSGRSNSVRLCLTPDRVVGYHQVHKGLLSASADVELVKTSKMYIYTYYLLVAI